MQPVGKATQYFLTPEISSQSQSSSTVKRKLTQTNQRGTEYTQGAHLGGCCKKAQKNHGFVLDSGLREERVTDLKHTHTHTHTHTHSIKYLSAENGKVRESGSIQSQSHIRRGTEKTHHCLASIIWSHY